MRQSKKIHIAATGLLCLATLTTGACVTRSTYDTAAADLNGAKVELRSTRIQTQELTQQVSELQQRQRDLARQMEGASSALQQAMKQMEAERTASHKRLSYLTRTIDQLTAQKKSLRYAFNRETKAQARLQSAVEAHTSKLGSADELNASPAPTPGAASNESAKTALVAQAQTPVPNRPAPPPTVTTPATPVNQTSATPTPPLAGNQPPEPVEEDWLTFLKTWIASLWQSVFF
jgi:septal ring factor EnvC (AmiA/AmiB activator)